MTDFTLVPDGNEVVLWEDPKRKLKLTANTSCSTEFVRLIEQTRFGSSGLRYRRLLVEEWLNSSQSKVYVSLTKEGVLTGTYVLDVMGLLGAGRKIQGVYRSMLCVADREQRSGLGRLIVENTLAWVSQCAQTCSRPVISFGCIERNNQSSLELLESTGAFEIGALHTQMVYRQWPRQSIDVLRLGYLELDELPTVDLLATQHRQVSDCGLVYEQPHAADYFAVMAGDEIIAGAYARVVHINFDRMGQPLDFLSEHVFARVGPARRRFNPRDFTYLKLDGVIVKPGSGPVWRKLLGTLLAMHGTHMAMFALDPSSRVYALLRASGVFGRVAKATRQELAVIASAHSRDVKWLRTVRKMPLGIGPFGQ